MNRFNFYLYFSVFFDNCYICNKSKKRLESIRECFIKCLRYKNMKRLIEIIVMNKIGIK